MTRQKVGILMFLGMFASGCIAGGGAVSDIVPNETNCHRPIRVGIRCVLFNGWSATTRNHTSVKLVFCRGLDQTCTVVTSVEAKQVETSVEFYADIPPIAANEDCAATTYWFEFLVDGCPNTSRRIVIDNARGPATL